MPLHLFDLTGKHPELLSISDSENCLSTVTTQKLANVFLDSFTLFGEAQLGSLVFYELISAYRLSLLSFNSDNHVLSSLIYVLRYNLIV